MFREDDFIAQTFQQEDGFDANLHVVIVGEFFDKEVDAAGGAGDGADGAGGACPIAEGAAVKITTRRPLRKDRSLTVLLKYLDR